MSSKLSLLMPVIVSCCHQLLVAVQLSDGRVAVTLQSLCKALNLNRPGQLQRIRRKKSLAKQLLLVRIATRGGWQQMDVLIAEAIPLWLDDIQSSRLSPEKRELVLALQEEAVDTLYRHFSKMNAAPPPPPQPERPTMSSDSPAQMIVGAVQTIGEAAQLIVGAVQTVGEAVQLLEAEHQATNDHLAAIDDRQEVIQETQQTVGERLAALEQRHEITEEREQAMGEYIVETRERVTVLEQRMSETPGVAAGSDAPSGSVLLSQQHLGQVYVLARAERSRSGESVNALLVALAQEFGVPDLSDLPDSAWNDVLGWFWQRKQHR